MGPPRIILKTNRFNYSIHFKENDSTLSWSLSTKSILFISGTGTFCIIADKRNVKVNNYASSGKYNVAKVDWLARCITLKALIPW